MSSAAKHLCRQARQLSQNSQGGTCRPTRRLSSIASSLPSRRRTFSSSTTRLAATPEDDSDSKPYFNRQFFAGLDRDAQAIYRTFTPKERRDAEEERKIMDPEFSPGGRSHREIEETARSALEELEQEYPEEPQEREPKNNGFFQMGEKEDIGPDDDFQQDDISSHAHGEMEQHREIREYARLAGWEMPLLANLAKPFNPPTQATPLRFRYTTYLGEQHPAARKVVVEFCPTDLSLSPAQSTKLIKLLGPRYNPSTQIARMSTESFETQAQNKRYLGDTVGALITEAKDTTDTFENVPFDFRHHKPKPKLRFPDEWLLTEERKAMLEAKRAERLEAAATAVLIDGVQEIEEGRKIDLQAVEAPVMAEARTALPKGKMGQRAVGKRS